MSPNDFETLTGEERELFNDQGIETAFQTWAATQRTVGRHLNLRRRFIDRTRELFIQIEAARLAEDAAPDRRAADRVDGYDRDDTGESPDY